MFSFFYYHPRRQEITWHIGLPRSPWTLLLSIHAQAKFRLTKVAHEGRAFVSLPNNPEHRLEL